MTKTKESGKIIGELIIKLIGENPGKYDENELADEIIRLSLIDPKIAKALAEENEKQWRMENR